jgi:hypothetical protein
MNETENDITVNFSCPYCDYKGDKLGFYNNHLKRHRFCDFEGCDYHSLSKTTFNLHQLRDSHSSIPLLECKYEKCEEYYFTLENLGFHEGRCMHQSRPFPCTNQDCEATFMRRDHMENHVKSVHSMEKLFKCKFEDCSSVFATSDKLRMHTKYHFEPKISCTYEGCEYKFFRNEKLQIHIRRSHTFEKPYSCDFEGCESSFVDKADVGKHKITHFDERPHECPHDGCESKFKDLGSLKTHVMIHLNEFPFQCNECDYKGRQSHHLKEHKQLYHTAEGYVRMKKEEPRIIKLLTDNNIAFTSQHAIDFTCLNDNSGHHAFIDFLIEKKDINGIAGIIMLEVDENQHRAYTISCEIKRMNEIFSSLAIGGNTLPISFIRYNPNSFSKDGVKKRDDYPKKLREEKLLETIANWEFTQRAGVFYMYYDSIDNEPLIMLDPEYNESFKNYFIGCI